MRGKRASSLRMDHAGPDVIDWPGRLEVARRHRCCWIPRTTAIGAAAGDALRDVFSARPIAFIFGASADKDVDGMFEHLLPIADYLVISQAVHPRALAPEEIERTALEHRYARPIQRIPDTRAALDQAAALVGPDGLICVTGSLFIVGEVRSACGLPAGHVPRAQRVPCIPARMAPTTSLPGADGEITRHDARKRIN